MAIHTTKREDIRYLVDMLPESELPTVERVLKGLIALEDPALWALENAPVDDEPDDEDDAEALRESDEDERAGRLISHEELKQRVGIR